MIQFHNPQRRPNQPAAGLAPADPTAAWGTWHGRKHYSIQVVQHPIRARQCGFGDKDRRPLAPAAVAKLVVRREDGSLVDVDDIDISFFVAAVDLWDESGLQEMNLVLHPSSERSSTTKPSTRRKLNSGLATFHTRNTQQLAAPNLEDNPPPIIPPQVPPVGVPAPDDTTLFCNPLGPHIIEASRPSWGYGSSHDSGQTLPSMIPKVPPQSSPGGWQPPQSDVPDYPTWNTDKFEHSLVGPAITPVENLGESWETRTAVPSPSFTNTYPPTPMPPTLSTRPSPYPIQKDGTYTRTLMGPLSSPAYKLRDQHRQDGIFFLFQDLSVRTEGTFRLRMRLMNVGASPAPEAGSTRVTESISPILAQTFTDSFTIYSAKRFPGVPDTTAMSIAFGNQGMKIPLRNRHGKRQRDGSDEDSS